MKSRQSMAHRSAELRQTALFVSREVWLAGLGAAALSRDWLKNEAGRAFSTLVREGKDVESRAVRLIGNRLEDTALRANTLWQHTRATLVTSARGIADDAAGAVRRVLPRRLPGLTQVEVAPAPKATRGTAARRKTAAPTAGRSAKQGARRRAR